MRTLIVDDEPRALKKLRHLCDQDENIEEVAVAQCGAAAIEMIFESRPDLLFLDVDLKDMTGFEVLRSLNPATQPTVIMVAAHKEHAAEAFRSGAVDYLTKPIAAPRFAAAIERVQEHRGLPSSQETNSASSTRASRAIAARGKFSARLVAQNSKRLYFLDVEDVDYIEACGNYVVIHAGQQKYLRRDTVKRLAAELREAGFEWIR